MPIRFLQLGFGTFLLIVCFKLTQYGKKICNGQEGLDSIRSRAVNMEPRHLFALAVILLSCLLVSWIGSCKADSNYLIGTGSYDITGPAADANLMGYADPAQNAAGIHFRLKSRAFIIAEADANGNRVAFVNLDACMGSQVVTLEVLSRLKARYGDTYNEKNVLISGTHTHSGPGGFLQHVLYIVTSLGFIHQSFKAIVDGIEMSIVRAHQNLSPGSILMNKGELLGANINRSPSAYLNNPDEEKARYNYNVDKTMVLLKFGDEKLGPVGAVNWFAVHGTSMNRSNKLVSGDNKGAASRFMEDWYESQSGPHNKLSIARATASADDDVASTGDNGGNYIHELSARMHRRRQLYSQDKPFVAAFAQTNEGDVSPNTLGAFCVDTGLPCDFNHSTCNGRNENCIGRGPGYPDYFSSTKIIAERQFQKAVSLFNTAKEQLVGKVDCRQTYVDFTNITVNLPTSAPGLTAQVVRTCPAAVGYSFAAGTTDGPGAFDFTQGSTKGNAFWDLVKSALKIPSAEQVSCQKPKPVLIDTGEMSTPYAWAPDILPIQILRVGQLIILGVPAEFTTMAGRRLRDAVKSTLLEKGNGQFSDSTVVIAGLSNAYSQYVTTYEEYQIQRYEGASTLYGPHTLSAYIQEFKKLAIALAEGNTVEPGPTPANLLNKQLEFLPPVVYDSTPLGTHFGDLKVDVPKNAIYKFGDIVEATFWSACPRNDLFTEKTFSLVEIKDAEDGTWAPVYDDDDWCTRFLWGRPSRFSGRSFATIRWEIPETAKPGVYRISHFGASKNILGTIRHFSGSSTAFTVT